ncbi:uncharacterized protein [Ptychodera flava]|uniref:uncharacterized protein isoform X1 n=1 Tax=Ptychodera flava TaxID=63121 RepID=UPI00396A8D16
MTRARRWWFEVERENDAVFVIFDYKGKGPSKLIPKKKNTPYSAVRKLETYDDSTHADKDLVKIVFSIPDEHPCKLSRSSFTWNKSEFSRKLRDFQTPVDFAEECNRLLKELRSKSTESGETSTSPCSSVSVSSNEELSDEEDDMDVEEDCPSIEGNSLISHTPRKPGTKKRKRLCEQAKTLVIPSLTKRQKVQEKVAQIDEETEAMKRSIRNCHIVESSTQHIAVCLLILSIQGSMAYGTQD